MGAQLALPLNILWFVLKHPSIHYTISGAVHGFIIYTFFKLGITDQAISELLEKSSLNPGSGGGFLQNFNTFFGGGGGK